ncbi:hypothetical protein GCM10007874_68010 [Labrys miyagiensis]|uniref:DUF1254 domain-containing protein n=1 Tax=Labrys miyagiensis TaxID=346912 RepID=A0ABQ6CUI7_9HYPH|nr:hypothetical protein GCM10007874_68010 [Labrys miyagiensis]
MIYGLPLVMNYAVFYDYFVNKGGSAFKAPPNQLYNTARVYTPADTTIVTPNSDTPYSFVAMDLRAEPFVVCNPQIEKSRYFSVQLVDFYTFNFGYMGSRASGNDPKCAMITGPEWKGTKPDGIDKVFQSGTDFAFALIRTQLFNSSDLENVKKIQSGYRAETLSAFLNQPTPPAAPPMDWPKIDKDTAKADPFAYLNFVLGLAPPVGPASVEIPMRDRFAKIGIEAGKPFDATVLSPSQKSAIELGMKSAMGKIKEKIANLGSEENGWRVAMHGFGDRAAYNGDYALRSAAALAGIYGNDAVEALYPILARTSDRKAPDTSANKYTLTFPAGQLPPANAFWSVTMYDAKTQLLIDNPINRYLVNSPMLPEMKKNADGSLTIYIQKDAPASDRASNWLPAPNGPAYIVMRIYWPKEAAMDGKWKPPVVQLVK